MTPEAHTELNAALERIRKHAKHGFCWRCEHRVRHWETGSQPRMECGTVLSAVSSCYMYKPVAPCIEGVARGYEDDPRPTWGAAIFCRRRSRVGIAEVAYHLYERPDGSGVVYALPAALSNPPCRYMSDEVRFEHYTAEARLPHTRRGWVYCQYELDDSKGKDGETGGTDEL